MSSENLLEVKDLKKFFQLKTGWFEEKQSVQAVNKLNLTIKKGETFGLVRESGCGKSTTGKLINGILEADAGDGLFNGEQLPIKSLNIRKECRNNTQIM